MNRTGIKLKSMKLGTSKCLTCKISDENLEHIIYECNNSKYVWALIEKVFRDIFEDNSITVSKPAVLTGFFDDSTSDKLLIMNVIISITRFHLWKIRNRIRYDFESISIFKNR